VANYGADSLRLYEMFMGPLGVGQAVEAWRGSAAVRGFLDARWRMILDDRAEASKLNPAVQDRRRAQRRQSRVPARRTIKAVSGRRHVSRWPSNGHRQDDGVYQFLPQAGPAATRRWSSFVLLLSPFARTSARSCGRPWPCQTAGLRALAGLGRSAHQGRDTIEVPVRFGGKLRARIMVPAEADREALEGPPRGPSRGSPELLVGKKVVKVVPVSCRAERSTSW